jgi:GT2 family glycosyltransferase
MISYIIPTRNRPDMLLRTLKAIDSLGAHDAEVIVVDNASETPVFSLLPTQMAVPVTALRLGANIAAAARNVGARRARGDWLIMLDDDSFPMSLDHVRALRTVADDVVAVMADISLPDGRREQGGLPEVFIGCGVAIRREAFVREGGYDATFGYYAEEYDLAARFLRSGYRIAFDPRFRVLHHKAPALRSKNEILERLVRNNGWVIQRYAPEQVRREQLGRSMRRYRAIANRETSLGGYGRGLLELRRTLREQSRTPLDQATWDRFTGLASARAALQGAYDEEPFHAAALVGRGKNDWAIEAALLELGCQIVSPGTCEDVRVAGTLSPGPMLDLLETPPPGVRLIPSSTLGVYAMTAFDR